MTDPNQIESESSTSILTELKAAIDKGEIDNILGIMEEMVNSDLLEKEGGATIILLDAVTGSIYQQHGVRHAIKFVKNIIEGEDAALAKKAQDLLRLLREQINDEISAFSKEVGSFLHVRSK